jgi:flagella basal body P-ring formation protein FlgA
MMRWLLLALALLLPWPAAADALADATEAALRARGLDGRLLVSVTAGAEVPLTGEILVDITALELTSGRFTATATARDASGVRQTRITGRVDRMIEVPVPNRAIARGELIAAADLDWIDVAMSRLGNMTITGVDSVVGYAVKRGLRPGQPISNRDIEVPVMVRKGTLVTMALDGPGLLLTATGRALEDSAVGQTISLINVQSKRTVQGTVVAPDQVRIDDGRRVALR